MKTYSDLQDIDSRLNLVIELEPVGNPTVKIIINDKEYDYTQLDSSIIINDYLLLMDLINIDIWGSNVYRGPSFGTLFLDYQKKSSKPLYISEYGADAYHMNDPLNPILAGVVNETEQADCAVGR